MQAFKTRGARVAILDCDEDARADVDAYVRADVSDYEAVRRAYDQVSAQLGAPDVVVNNAGWIACSRSWTTIRRYGDGWWTST